MTNEQTQEAEDALKRAIAAAGGGAALSRALAEYGAKASPQAISQWKITPPERVGHIEMITKVPRFELRPDLWPRDPVIL